MSVINKGLEQLDKIPNKLLKGVSLNTHKNVLMKFYNDLLEVKPNKPLYTDSALELTIIPQSVLNVMDIEYSIYKEIFSHKIDVDNEVISDKSQDEHLSEIMIKKNLSVKELTVLFIVFNNEYYMYKSFNDNDIEGNGENYNILFKFNDKFEFAVFLKKFVTNKNSSTSDLVDGRFFDDVLDRYWYLRSDGFYKYYIRIWKNSFLDDEYLIDLRNTDSYINFVVKGIKDSDYTMNGEYRHFFD